MPCNIALKEAQRYGSSPAASTMRDDHRQEFT